MAWARRWRIDSRSKLVAICRALIDIAVDFKAVPCELIIRTERVEKADWQRGLFHAICADVAPLWGLTPGEVKERVKLDFYGGSVVIEKGVLTPDEVMEFQRLLGKVGRYLLEVQSSEESDYDEYGRLIDHLYQMVAESGNYLPDRRRS